MAAMPPPPPVQPKGSSSEEAAPLRKTQNYDFGLGRVEKGVRKTIKKVVNLTNIYQVDPRQGFTVAAWIGASALLGWQAFSWYHGDLNQDCFAGTFEPDGFYKMSPLQQANASYTLSNGITLTGADLGAYGKTSAPGCNPYGKNYYIAIGVAGLMFLCWAYERFQEKAIQMCFSTATMEFNSGMFSLSDPIDLKQSRMWQYFGHTISALGFFFIWLYIDGGSDESKGLIHESGRTLTGMTRAWMVVFPTCIAEVGTLASNGYDREKWITNHMGWAARSILHKLVIVLTLHFVLDPQTQMLWMHKDDSPGQTNWVIGITSALGFMMIYFWYKYLSQRFVEWQDPSAAGGPVQRLQNRLWAYVDFPTNLTLAAMVAYNVTARLKDEHGNTHLPADFHSGLLYLLLVSVGILNIPVNIVDADWAPSAERIAAQSENKIDASEGQASKFNVMARASKQVATVHMKKPQLNLKAIENQGADDNL